MQYLEKELQSLQPKLVPVEEGGEKTEYIRSKNTQGPMAKKKFDSIERIFQSFADIVYFMEFIHDHPELQDSYEKDLENLFGINFDQNSIPSHHKKQVGAFERLIRAILLIDTGVHAGEKRELDFRVHLVKILIWCSIEAMRSRMTDNDLIKLMIQDSDRVWTWSKFLSSRVKGKPVAARRNFGF